MQKRKKTLFAAGIGAMAVILAAIAFQYGRDKGYFSFYREGAVLPVIREGKTDQIEKSDDRKKQLMMYVSDTTGLYNPAFVQTSGDQAVSSLIFQPLMEETMEGGMKAVLADEVSVSEDGLMYQVMLKGNRKFSDGTVVSADDVIASVAAEMLLHGEEEDSPYGRIKGYEQFVQDQREFPSGLRKLGDREVIIEFTQADPDNRKVLLTDITYIPYNGTFGYLSTILDAYTKQILSYVVSDSLEVDFVLETVNKLVRDHGIELGKETLIHSDQGCHYTSMSFVHLVKDKQLRQSMSRRGNCWDNAPQESFFGHMKDEIEVSACKNFREVKAIIDDWMNYYNNERYQWQLEKLSPNEYYEYITTGIYPLEGIITHGKSKHTFPTVKN